ncbi:hypothetical protein [Catonella massiliensis]|uniref:Uncharacterized protein n=1 Tax=Catonella massiliensis TaxID=2799636 RepID=A0ABS1J3Q3_9FIRM|nr:hypothetical protein [Catonella massiliensis]MBK5898148.1 hypothetical protein [Catonella massiliensis]
MYGKVYEEADTYFPDEIKKEFRETETILADSFDGAGFKTCVYTKII